MLLDIVPPVTDEDKTLNNDKCVGAFSAPEVHQNPSCFCLKDDGEKKIPQGPQEALPEVLHNKKRS